MNDLLQGVGLFMCIGAVLLVVAVAALSRRAFAGRTPRQMDTTDPNIFEGQGAERPRYDDDDIRSRGGFGSAPGAGRSGSNRSGSFGSSSGGAQRFDSPSSDFERRSNRPADRRDDDDDDVRSRGGFGG